MTATTTVKKDVNADLTDAEKRVRELERELAEVKKERDAFKPTFDVPDVTTPDEFIDRMGSQWLQDAVALELADVNRKRLERGLPRIDHDPASDEFMQIADRLVATALARRQSEVKVRGPLTRTLKMVKPNGNLTQVPVEAQFNNMAGSLSDATARYRNKGFRTATPIRCMAQDCWVPASVVNGEWEHGGYCCDDHYQRTEKKAAPAEPSNRNIVTPMGVLGA